MFIIDEGLIISVVKYTDKKKIIRVFTSNNGMKSFIIQINKKNYSTTQIGNLINIQWRNNNTKNLIFATCETKKSKIHNIMQNYSSIILTNTLIDILNITIVEHNVHKNTLYNSIKQIIDNNLENKQDYYKQLTDYCYFEITLLKDSGYALSLDKCIITGSTTELKYISPRSGCAVIKEFGEQYKKKLFLYPTILKGEKPNFKNIRELLLILKYFINKHILQPSNKKIPQSRLKLEHYLNKEQ